ncbi:hypothetical protein G7Y89_g2346 [Cudoniella acicularis]|uniref:Uncharacterized protein n=1 Tax=Cudoniella acicularis TaxID=354080 RepID=A0A8H4W662_9HELO|nr:hypothetical protein G7Y89_g2346 [Cudoniella acicularis]
MYKLKAGLPALEIEEIKSGLYHLNLHIVTGRKLPKPYTGDLLADGTRQEMSPPTYDAIARFDAGKEASIILKSFTTLQGVPGQIPGDKAYCGVVKLQLSEMVTR